MMIHDRNDKPLSSESIGLVAVDLDGTLLRADNSISVASAEAIGEAMRRGVKVVIASGRAPRHVRQIASALGIQTWQVVHNGALVVDPTRNAFVFHLPMPPELAQAVVRLGRQFDPRVAIGVELVDRCVSERPNADLSIGVGGPPPGAGAVDEATKFPVTKIMMAGPPELLGGIQLALMERLPGQVSFAFSHMRLLQVSHGQADKATALARVAAHYHVPRQGVLAIGDAPNDLGMLRWAGLSIAVDSEWSDVRRAAHFIAPANDQDPVAWALRKYVLARA